MLQVALALAPVTAFLLLLVLFDSFKLVPKTMLAAALAGGAFAAGAAAWLHGWLLTSPAIDPTALSRYVAPVTEEALKGLVLFVPFARRQIGFLVDAAIVGFAIGTGFALVENVDYLRHLASASVWVWITRGFGTAILHGATTTIVAVTAKSLVDRGRALPVALAPGWVGAVLLHSAFNHTLVSPILAASMLMLVLPLAVLAVYGAVLPYGGFVVPTIVFLVLWVVAFHRRPLPQAVVLAVLLSAGGVTLFHLFLGVPIPLWPWHE